MGGLVHTWADCRGAYYRTTVPGPAVWVEGESTWVTFNNGFAAEAMGSGLIRSPRIVINLFLQPGLQDPLGMQVLRARYVDEKVADELIGVQVKFDNGQVINLDASAFVDFGGSGQTIPEPEGETPYAQLVDLVGKLVQFTS